MIGVLPAGAIAFLGWVIWQSLRQAPPEEQRTIVAIIARGHGPDARGPVRARTGSVLASGAPSFTGLAEATILPGWLRGHSATVRLCPQLR